MARNMDLNLIGCSIVVIAFIIGATEATVYNVGDSYGWNIPANESFYSDWASTKNFSVGDDLVFRWKGDHTVADVSKADYDNCTKVSSYFGSSNTNDTEFQVTLSTAGPRYFTCIIETHCARGQKFNINVVSPNSAAPTVTKFLSSNRVFWSLIIIWVSL